MKAKEITNQSIYNKNHKARLWYKMERVYAKNKKKMTKM